MIRINRSGACRMYAAGASLTLLLFAAVASHADRVDDLSSAAWQAHRAAGGQVNDDPAVIEAVDRLWQLHEDDALSDDDRAKALGDAIHILYHARGLEAAAARFPVLAADDPAWGPVLDVLMEAEAWERVERRSTAVLANGPSAALEQRSLYALGTAQGKRGDREAGQKALARLVRSHPESRLASVARGDLHELANLNVGAQIPAFEATDLDGKTVSPGSLRGKVVLVDFWSTY